MKNFITIEGCDGVGKTTQIKLLKEYCANNGIDALFTREPGGSRIAEQIRNIILDAANVEMSDRCEAFLYASARAQHLHEIIIPALADGKVVLCDRFIDSSLVYQGVARGLGIEYVYEINLLAVGENMPDYTLFLDLPPKEAFIRKGGVDTSDRLEIQDISFHQKVYEGYCRLIKLFPERFIVIDASGSLEQTHEKIVTALKYRKIF